MKRTWDIYEKQVDGTCVYLGSTRNTGQIYLMREYLRANFGVFRKYEVRIRLVQKDFIVQKLANGTYSVFCNIVAFAGTACNKQESKNLIMQYIEELKTAPCLTEEQYVTTQYVYQIIF